jgi:hypothetical protein
VATECRAAAGPCDVAESCTGASAACPSDAFRPASTICRPATGACDPAESCTGDSAACPTDVFTPGAGDVDVLWHQPLARRGLADDTDPSRRGDDPR